MNHGKPYTEPTPTRKVIVKTKKKRVDKDRMAASAGEAEDLLKRLANQNRLMILCLLTEGERSVGDMNEQIPLSQSALSQHLAVLRDAGLVATRRESQTIFYRLEDPRVTRVLETLYAIFCEN